MAASVKIDVHLRHPDLSHDHSVVVPTEDGELATVWTDTGWQVDIGATVRAALETAAAEAHPA